MFQCSTLTTMKCHLHLRRLLHTDVTAVDANAISSSIIATTISNRNANTNNNHNHNHNKEKTQKRRRKHRSNADVVESNKAISAHMRHGRIDSARQLFDEMPRKTTVTYNALLSGYISNNLFHLALQTFHSMPHRDVVSYNTLMQGYVRNRNIAAARKLFDEMPAKDTVSWNTLISAYADSGHVEMAKKVFDEMPEKNSISWNGLLAAYVQNGMIDAARKLFDEVDHWETVSWNAMIAGYVRRKRLVEAGILFERMPRRDVVSWNTMISGHAQSGDIREAVWLFEKTPKRDVFTWTAMVSGFAQNGMLVEARRVFDGMPERNAISWNAMIGAYVQARDMSEAMSLFEAMPCKNSSSWNTILTGFAQGGRIEDARYVFDNMPQRDPVSWAAMIAGYSQGGFSEEALQLFLEMARSGEQLNRSSFTCALSTCADIALLECGKQLHGRLVKAGYGLGCFVGNALLAMYCKCGSIEEAFDAFKEIADKDVVSWNTMIAGYARHGFGKEALQVFDEMRTTAIRPDDITLVGVLLACSHAGLVDKGIAYFDSMQREYNVSAKAEHYTCMIDLLGRAGRLEDAQALVREVPMEPDAAMWGALLGASRIHKNTKLGEEAAEKLFEMEPDNSGMYVLLSNIYASSGKWKNVRKLRNSMQEKGVRKMPGFSWIEVKNAVHTFSVGDSVHPEKDKIYAFLEKLDGKMKKKGYVSATEMVLHDVEEEEKEHMLKYHSEKLAVAFGILNVPHGRPIRVIKNLRVCEDCHTAIKYISAIESRLIILRDSNRFHHFSGGTCSCGDYW